MKNIKDYFGYVETTGLEQIQAENNLEEDEILLPEVEEEIEITEEELDEFVIMPTGKYEMLIRDSERLAAVTRYVCGEKPCMKSVKALLEVE